MRESRLFLAAAAASLITAGFTAANAGAAAKTARFKVTVSGSQTTSWTLDNTSFDPCIQGNVRQSGSGRQKMSFRSRRPATAIAGRFGKTTIFTALTGGRTPGARVKGSVTRHAQVQSQQLSGNGQGCGSGSGGPAPTPDCGKHAFKGSVDMRWITPAEWPGEPPVPLVPVLLLEGPQIGNLGIAGMYEDCPGGQADQLIPTVSSALPAKKLFGRSRHFTIRGKDTQTNDTNGFHAVTRVSWVAKFTRLKGKFKPPKPPLSQPQCADGRDNDGDGKTDYPQDSGCTSPTDDSE